MNNTPPDPARQTIDRMTHEELVQYIRTISNILLAISTIGVLLLFSLLALGSWFLIPGILFGVYFLAQLWVSVDQVREYARQKLLRW